MITIAGRNAPEAWLSAMQALSAQPRELQDLVVEIEQPQIIDSQGLRICRTVDEYLRRFHDEGLEYVANTIFPLALYERHGWPKMAVVYRDHTTRRSSPGWGGYFGRLVEVAADDNQSNLETLVDKLVRRPGHHRNVYEANALDGLADFAIYDPVRDRKRTLQQPCMSHLSIRIFDGHLCITALYRSHYYTQKALGNFIGLARLQGFLSKETKIPCGGLCVHSCHARLDHDGAPIREVSGMIDSLTADRRLAGGPQYTVMDGPQYLMRQNS